MIKHIIMRGYKSLFGMGVDARSVTVKGFSWVIVEQKVKAFVNCPKASEIAGWMGANFETPHHIAYESGARSSVFVMSWRRWESAATSSRSRVSIAQSVDGKRRKTE